MSREGEAFIAHLLDLLEPMGACSVRRMFGGYGIYLQRLMFAIAFDSRFFLKVDNESKAKFIAAGATPFLYENKGKRIEMSYWTVPEQALESAEDMKPWATLAYAAALRAARAKELPKAATRARPAATAVSKKAPAAQRPVAKARVKAQGRIKSPS